MYFPFLQNDYNSFFYYCINPFEIELQSSEKATDSHQDSISPSHTLKTEEKDAEDIESYNLDNITITVQELREAGYEKKKQPWTEE